jgi:hypothetical protein
MLESAAMIAVYGHDALADWEELDENRSAARDYAWMLSLNLVRGTERAWHSFQSGYAAGGEIGRRRYGRSAGLPLNHVAGERPIRG